MCLEWSWRHNSGSKGQRSTSKPLRQDTNWKQLSLIYTASTFTDTAIVDCGHNYGYNKNVMLPFPKKVMLPFPPITNVLNATSESNESNCLSQILGSLRSIHCLYKRGPPQRPNWNKFQTLTNWQLADCNRCINCNDQSPKTDFCNVFKDCITRGIYDIPKLKGNECYLLLIPYSYNYMCFVQKWMMS